MRGGPELSPAKKKKPEDGTKEARVRYPIGMKLVVIITILLLTSLGLITFLVSWMVGQDVQLTAEDNNFNVNRRSSTETEAFLNSVQSSVVMLLDFLGSGEGDALSASATASAAATAVANTARVAAAFFEQTPSTVALMSTMIRPDDSAAILLGIDRVLVNERWFATNGADPAAVDSYILNERLPRVLAGETIIENVTPRFGVSLLAMYIPYRRGGETLPIVVFFTPDSLADSFGTGGNMSFLLNDADDVLIHPDTSLMSAGASMINDPFVREMRVRADRNFQTRYTGDDGEQFFGAYQKLNIANAVVVTLIHEGLVFEGVQATTRRNLYLTGMVLFLSMLFIYLFSKTISQPLRTLTRAAGQIENGRYQLDLKPRGRDEIGLLTTSFVKMGEGLAERERLKDTFGRFTNKAIAEQAMRGQLTLGGETKNATIFFSDIRSFTAISEKMEPNEVVGFLNDYMTRMVACVNKTGGVVDKFIGDAVMAVWGAPMSAGSVAGDALNCVKAALMMRDALREFNVGRGGDKKPIIKIGCGINTGSIVAGQIGSSERMEYTVIGDAVNLASRTEALNKPLGTDILITENTWEYIHDHIVTEEMPPVSVKGKEKPVRMFAVVNLRTQPQIKPDTLAEVRALLHIQPPDLSTVDMDAEEQKYKIGTAAKPAG